jgi:diguanylate cyclase (GGDEF)-like protein/PAS domain S-box-containing protein
VARLTIDQEGRRRVRGIETDVTALKRAEEQARDSEARFRLLSDASRDSVVVHAGGTAVEVNQAFCRQFGWSPEEALGLQPEGYVAPESIDLLRAQRVAGSTAAFELIGLHRSGERRWYSALGRETRFHGELAQVLVLTDITELKRRETAALHDAEHDRLTGLQNRVAFDRRLELELELGRREPGRMLGMLYCDLNGFKAVNDSLGHAAGDAVLQRCAELLRSVVRESDPVFRVGGDEFVILLPRLSEAEAECVTALKRDQLHSAFASGVALGTTTADVGVAVGSAICPRDGRAAEVLVHHADAAMYADKRAARSLRPVRRPQSG